MPNCLALALPLRLERLIEDGIGERGMRLPERGNRAAHNELEKTRRANLRGYLDKLKDIIPASCDSTRYTTLSLLTQARDYIMVSLWPLLNWNECDRLRKKILPTYATGPLQEAFIVFNAILIEYCIYRN
uniref:BHLH domain-containing protein n=1 Tax=Parascaris equorum TaxID=6256 RepID=A0A914RDG2_PAREQ